MKVGVPTEIKTDEYRVALTPAGVRELVEHGHEVVIQAGAGEGSAIDDGAYEAQGAVILPDADAVFGEADMVHQGQGAPAGGGCAARGAPHAVHLPPPRAGPRPDPGAGRLRRRLRGLRDRRGSTRGRLPLLAPMSEVAGKIATQAGAFMLEKPLGGRGILLGGVPGVAAAKVMVIGGGVVGMNAAFIAIGMEAEVYVYDRNIDRLRELDIILLRPRVHVLRVDARDRAAPRRGRPRDRRRARARRQGPVRRAARAAQADEAGRGARRRVDRPGRLLRDVAPDDPLRPDLRGRRHHPLLRGQHAGRGAGHLDLRADERDAALRAARRRQRRRRRRAREPGPRAGRQRRRRQGHLPAGGGGDGAAVHAAVRGAGRGRGRPA